jgi:hypothetical protein
MITTKDHVGTVVLVDRKTRVVEVLGPELPGSRYATDRQPVFHEYRMGMNPPRRIGLCFPADGRRARFLIDQGKDGDALLHLLASRPRTPARRAKPHGIKGWLVEG